MRSWKMFIQMWIHPQCKGRYTGTQLVWLHAKVCQSHEYAEVSCESHVVNFVVCVCSSHNRKHSWFAYATHSCEALSNYSRKEVWLDTFAQLLLLPHWPRASGKTSNLTSCRLSCGALFIMKQKVATLGDTIASVICRLSCELGRLFS